MVSKEEALKELYQEDDTKRVLKELGQQIFKDNVRKGFWEQCFSKMEEIVDNEGNLVGYHCFGKYIPERRNFGEAIALVHSELSEALEAHRKNLKDSHLPQYDGRAVELADALIRILDMAEGYGYGDILGQIVLDKLAYNRKRPPKHGKKF